jgi:hypothetical protein
MPLTFVQVSPTVSVSSGTLTATLPGNTGSGNTLVACISMMGSTGVRVPTGITLGGAADNWRAAYTDPTATGFSGAIWYDPGCASGQTSVVLSSTAGSGTQTDIYLTVYEITGLLVFDKGINGDSASSPAATWTSGATAGTWQPNEIFFATSAASTQIPVVTGAGSWTTQSTGAGTFDQIAGYQIVSATGTATYSGTFTASGNAYAAVVATFGLQTAAVLHVIPAAPVVPPVPARVVSSATQSFTATAGLAAGTGAAGAPAVGLTPGLATAAGVAQPVAQQGAAGLASGNAAVVGASAGVNAAAGLASGTGAAQAAASGMTPGLATGTGAGQNAVPGAGGIAAVATAPGVTAPAGPGLTSGLAAGTGAAQGLRAGLTPVLATGTGTGQPPAIPTVRSPVLTASGFGTFPQIPAGSVITAVIATVAQHSSNLSCQAPSYELWDGTSAIIGTAQNGTLSTSAANQDSVVFTGVSYSQLATLQLRIYAVSQVNNTGQTVSVDAAGLSVEWSVSTSAAVAPATLRTVPAFPRPNVLTGSVVSVGVLAVVPAFPAPTAGQQNALALPAPLAVRPAFPLAAAAGGITVTPGVLAVVPAFPVITDVTSPGWATADSSGGSWVNPANILGPPDGSNAVWTVP